jgi:chromate transporter
VSDNLGTSVDGSTVTGRVAPRLVDIFLAFTIATMQSFGGGLTSWIQRDVVGKRAWMTDSQFLSAFAMCQVLPGPNAVNLAVFIGTTLRGALGAAAALLGMIGVPFVIVLGAGASFSMIRDVSSIGSAFGGVGAAAIGLNLAMGLRMLKGTTRSVPGMAIILASILMIGVFQMSFYVSLPILVLLSAITLYLGRNA